LVFRQEKVSRYLLNKESCEENHQTDIGSDG